MLSLFYSQLTAVFSASSLLPAPKRFFVGTTLGGIKEDARTSSVPLCLPPFIHRGSLCSSRSYCLETELGRMGRWCWGLNSDMWKCLDKHVQWLASNLSSHSAPVSSPGVVHCWQNGKCFHLQLVVSLRRDLWHILLCPWGKLIAMLTWLTCRISLWNL